MLLRYADDEILGALAIPRKKIAFPSDGLRPSHLQANCRLCGAYAWEGRSNDREGNYFAHIHCFECGHIEKHKLEVEHGE